MAYKDDKPVSITKVVIATQHDDMLNKFENQNAEHEFVEKEIIKHVIKPVLDECGLPYDESFIVNGTGRFVFGGPEADTGLTGRKIIVDTYGGYAPHGGGAFSGKDPTKVDRSAAYMARWLAKNVVLSELADWCSIQLSYAIGVKEPTSFYIDSNGDNQSISDLITASQDLTPLGIIRKFDLFNFTEYSKNCVYGHFGDKNVPWEKTEKF